MAKKIPKHSNELAVLKAKRIEIAESIGVVRWTVSKNRKYRSNLEDTEYWSVVAQIEKLEKHG